MKINMKSANATLATQGTYCPEDVEIAVALQEKTAAANGEVVPDSGYAGLGKVVVAVPDPDAVIIDVTALPTEDVDPDAYYRLDGKLYKKPDTAVGTWVLNETIEKPTQEASYKVKGTLAGETVGVSRFNINAEPSESTAWYLSYLFIGGMNVKAGYSYYYDGGASTSGAIIDNTVSGGISLIESSDAEKFEEARTFTITGGTDAKNSDLVAWLKANAVRTKLGDDWDCYLVPSGSVEITENGTVDVTEYASVTVGTPTGAEITQTGTTVRIG